MPINIYSVGVCGCAGVMKEKNDLMTEEDKIDQQKRKAYALSRLKINSYCTVQQLTACLKMLQKHQFYIAATPCKLGAIGSDLFSTWAPYISVAFVLQLKLCCCCCSWQMRDRFAQLCMFLSLLCVPSCYKALVSRYKRDIRYEFLEKGDEQ